MPHVINAQIELLRIDLSTEMDFIRLIISDPYRGDSQDSSPELSSLAGVAAPKITALSLSESVALRNNRPSKELIIARTIGVLSIRLVYPRRWKSAAHVLPLVGRV